MTLETTRDPARDVPRQLPVLDVAALVRGGGDRPAVAAAIGEACREHGFFYVTGHGVDMALLDRLEQVSRQFFALPSAQKQAIRMERGGRAWRGYFAVGGELTSGRPDLKEGLYFGSELDDGDPRVQAGIPLHGRNLFPSEVPDLRGAVLDTMAALTQLGHVVMEGIALSLGLDARYFADRYTGDPTILFRIFNYPPPNAPAAPAVADDEPAWGVGEHTDYGLLTLLWQDTAGGLQVKSGARWIDAPPIPGTFVCNIGDMLDRMTGGLYLSTPHRVLNPAGRDRLSFPFFFDPAWDAEIRPIQAALPARDNQRERWDQASVHAFRGTYGDYLLGKVAKVFPDLRQDVIP